MNDQHRSATDHLGSHLLGRKRMPKDERDYRLEDYLAPTPADAPNGGSIPLDPSMTLQDVYDETDYFRSWRGLLAFWRWVKTTFKPAPTPPPLPPAPGPDATWADTDVVLDQGQTGHCVGFGWSQWGNTQPVDDHYTNTDGHAVYYEAKVIDGEPRAEDGSNTRSGAKAMQQRGRLKTYAFASSTATITQWLEQHGSVIVGTDWENDMFTPDADGYLRVSGGVAGGHEYLLIGYSATGYGNVHEPSYTMLNSWGSSWSRNGRAYIRVADFEHLLANQGDACAAAEIA